MENFKRFTELKTYPNGKKGYIQYSVSGCYNDMNCKGDYTTGESVDRFAELEDKMENGTLVELPCRVGDVIYYCCQIKKVVEKHVVTGFDISKELSIRTISDCYSNGNYVGYFYPSYFNKTLFKNKVDADAKLKEFL